MSDNTTKVFDGIVSIIKGILPNYIQLADALDIQNNDQMSLKQGFSVDFEGGVNDRDEVCEDLRVERQYNFVLTRQFNDHPTNPAGRIADKKTLMENATLVWKEIEAKKIIGGVEVRKSEYVDDSGVQLIGEQEQKYITILAVVSASFLA